MEFLRQLMNGLAQAWGRLAASARVNIVIAGLAVIVLIGLITFQGGQTTFVRLFDGVEPAEMAKIVDALNAEAVPYKLSNNETTVSVPVDKVSAMRLSLSNKGLPSTQGTAPGYELFKETDLMSNRWLQDIKLKRAIQGELQRQLNQFDFINKSFVFISEAKEEIFSSKQLPSKAAVTIDVKRRPSAKEIQAILHTVSSFGGPQLSINDITLATTSGELLKKPQSDDEVGIASSKLEYQAELERQREQKVLAGFKELGVKAIVKVSALVDFDSSTLTTKSVEEGAPISTQVITNKSDTDEKPPQGAPGATANAVEGSVQAGGTKTTEEVSQSTQNYEVGNSETKKVTTPGKVKRYMVSAIVQGETKTTKDASGKETKDYAGLTPERQTAYENMIKAAVGQGEEPTDVSVDNQPFEITELAEAQMAATSINQARMLDVVIEYGSNMIKIALLVVGFWLVRRLLKRMIVIPVNKEEVEQEEAAALRASQSPEDRRREEVMAEVTKLSQQEPAAVAALLRSWLSEEEEM